MPRQLSVGPAAGWGVVVIILTAYPTFSAGEWTASRVVYAIAFIVSAAFLLISAFQEEADKRVRAASEAGLGHGRHRELLSEIASIRADQEALKQLDVAKAEAGEVKAALARMHHNFDVVVRSFEEVYPLYDRANDALEDIGIVLQGPPTGEHRERLAALYAAAGREPNWDEKTADEKVALIAQRLKEFHSQSLPT